MIAQHLGAYPQLERALECRGEDIDLIEIDGLGAESQLMRISTSLECRIRRDRASHAGGQRRGHESQFHPSQRRSKPRRKLPRVHIPYDPARTITETGQGRTGYGLTAIKYSCPPFKLNTLFLSIPFVALSVRYLGSSCWIMLLAMSRRVWAYQVLFTMQLYVRRLCRESVNHSHTRHPAVITSAYTFLRLTDKS